MLLEPVALVSTLYEKIKSSFVRAFLKSRAFFAVVAYSALAIAGQSPFPGHWQFKNFSSFLIVSSEQTWGELKFGNGYDHKPVYANGVNYPHSIVTHAHSRIIMRAKGSGKTLSGTCGYPDGVSAATIQCSIQQNNRELIALKHLHSAARTTKFSVPIDPSADFVLEINSMGREIHEAHGFWANLATN
jgi:hypothetical protein